MYHGDIHENLCWNHITGRDYKYKVLQVQCDNMILILNNVRIILIYPPPPPPPPLPGHILCKAVTVNAL